LHHSPTGRSCGTCIWACAIHARVVTCDTWPRPSPDSLASLIAAGVTQSVAQELASTCDPAAVVGWVDCTNCAKGITNPPAFVVARLIAGEPPPEVALANDDPRHYISGRTADLIQHWLGAAQFLQIQVPPFRQYLQIGAQHVLGINLNAGNQQDHYDRSADDADEAHQLESAEHAQDGQRRVQIGLSGVC